MIFDIIEKSYKFLYKKPIFLKKQIYSLKYNG